MKDTSEWIIVCFWGLIFAALVGIFGGIVAGDRLALQVALIMAIWIAVVALVKAKKGGL